MTARKKLIVGLTGGIGSGKSEVSRRFEKLGTSVVDADEQARVVVQPGSMALAKIAEHFGSDILTNHLGLEVLDRAKLRAIIFADSQQKYWLEQLLHPIIYDEIRRLLTLAPGVYAILSSPLLLETNQHQLVDRVLVVDTTEELQLKRATARDQNNETQIKAIMASQLSRTERCKRADDMIHNNGNMNDLDEQVARFHQYYVELAAVFS